MDSEMEVGVSCGVCGSDDIHMHPCDECEFVQFSVCFACGEMYHLPASCHDRGCSKRPRSSKIIPLYDENLNRIEEDE